MKKQVFLPLLLMFALLTGCASASVQPEASAIGASSSQTISHVTQSAETRQKLCITAALNSDANTMFQSDELGESFSHSLHYYNVEDVQIQLGEESMPLEDALANQRITEEEIFRFARTDARNGFCQETVESSLGLSHFTYHYPTVNIRLVYDVYETPDGNQHLISHMAVYGTDDSFILEPYTDFRDPETLLRLDSEDWGLSFTVTESTASSVTIVCQQSGGQQIGQLFVDWYDLRGSDPSLPDSGESPSCSVPLTMGGTTTFTLDWTEDYGELSGGEYRLSLNIRDHFDESQVHSLMQDFHDWQVYDVKFTIP